MHTGKLFRLPSGFSRVFLSVFAAVAFVLILAPPAPADAGWSGNDFTLTVDVSTGGGTVSVDLNEDTPLPYIATYAEGSIIIVEAKPSFGYVFHEWSGDVESTDNPEFILMDCNKMVAASFVVNWRLIGTIVGSAILIVLLGVTLYLRRGVPDTTKPEETAPDDENH